MPFNVDYISFCIVDKKVAKRTAIQEQSIAPLRAYNQIMVIDGRKTERTVFALPRFTLPEGKQLLVELNEKMVADASLLHLEMTIYCGPKE